MVSLEQNPELLSRQRRFAIPSSSGWSITTELTFELSIPLEGLDTSVTVEVPFEYSLDLGR